MKREQPTWKDVVVEALADLGGQAHLSEIYSCVERDTKTAAKRATNPTWQDTIRRVVRQYRVFEPVPPDRSGVYKLVDFETPPPQSQDIDSGDPDINHGVAQGMLVSLGSIYGYETFVPAYDQSTREFQGASLGDLVSVRDCSDILEGQNLPRVRQIDVLWFDEDDHGLFPAYGFEVEHTTRVKDALDRLLKIPARFRADLFVIGPDEEKQSLFNRLMKQTPFRDHRNRFLFRLYRQLQDVYNAATRHSRERDNFGVIERYMRG